jgi:hypothetical protein
VPFNKGQVAEILKTVDLGSSVAEKDELLESARVETSVFGDLLADRVDLVPGTKGSGKSALYRMFVDFLAPELLRERKVVVAHGVRAHGDNVFQAFKERFQRLSEDEFVDFWCIYLVSLAHEQFLKNPEYKSHLARCGSEIDEFRRACDAAGIPEITARKSLRDVLEWVLNALQRMHPKVAYVAPEGGKVELTLFDDVPQDSPEAPSTPQARLPRYVGDIKAALEAVLTRADLSLWLMVDRLDEIFPRRSQLETKALRGLLRTLDIFESRQIRVKVFLRDDILEQVTTGEQGFTALTHVTAREAATLQWSPEDILMLILKRLFASNRLCVFLGVDRTRLAASQDYRLESFYKVFPKTVYSPPNQSRTLEWIYSHTKDGRGVVTPRDVIDLLTKAKQHQQDEFQQDPIGLADSLIGSGAIRYGLAELSKRKRAKVLKAEFPHLWPEIAKFIGGKTEYTETAIRKLLGGSSRTTVADLVSIGLLEQLRHKSGSISYRIPFLYRDGLELTQGRQV